MLDSSQEPALNPPASSRVRPTLTVGARAAVTRVLTVEDIRTFAQLSGDANPIHTDPAAAAVFVFGRPIAHGMMLASTISAVLGTQLPGPGSLYLGQDLEFLAPAFPGDTITAEVEVVQDLRRGMYKLSTRCVNQLGEVLVNGSARVKLLH